ncbi:MAG: ferritin [Nitrospinota bacterium]
MLHEKMQQALNVQINEEIYSSYLYLSMEADLEQKGFKGFASWMQMQVQEELAHAKKLFGYVNERQGKVELLPVNAPPKGWESPQKVFEAVCKHEADVSEKINALLSIALELKDHATSSYLQWYVNEQVEEEANANGILDRLKIADGNGHALLMLDNELGQRVFVNPLTSAE